MVNYGRLECKATLLAIFIALTTAAPSPHRFRLKYYDQRQNGTENYSVRIKNVAKIFPLELITNIIGDFTDQQHMAALVTALALSVPFYPIPLPFGTRTTTTTEIPSTENNANLGEKPLEETIIEENTDQITQENKESEKPKDEKPEEEKLLEEKPLSDVLGNRNPLEDKQAVKELQKETTLTKEQQLDVLVKPVEDAPFSEVKNIDNVSS